MVERLLVRRPRVRRPHGHGGPVQARLPAGRGRAACGPCRAPDRGAGQGRQGQLPGARQGAGHHHRHAAGRQARRWRRGGAGRRGPGAAGVDAQHQLEPAGGHAAAPGVGRGDFHRADGDHRPAPLRQEGRARGRRRRPHGHARAAGHAAAVAARHSAGRERPGAGDSAAQRRAHHLQGGGGGGCGNGPVRHRRHEHPRHAGPADHQRPATAGARGGPVPRAAHAAQHHQGGDEGRGHAACHAAAAGPADRGDPRRRVARGGVVRHRARAAGPDACPGAAVGDRGARYGERRARCAQGDPAAGAGRAAGRAAGHAGAAGRQLPDGGGAARRCAAGARRPQAGAAAPAGRGPARRARLVGQLPVRLPGAKGQQGHRPARCRAVAQRGRADAHLPGRRRLGLLLPAERRQCEPGQRHAHRLPTGRHTRSGRAVPRVHAACRSARGHGARADGFRGRTHPARLLEPAQGSGPAQAGGHRGAVAHGPCPGAAAREHHHRAQPVADACGDRLDQRAQAGAGRAAARAAPGRGDADPQGPPVLPGHQAAVQHRAAGLLVVADAERRREHRAPDAGRAGRPRVEGRHGAPGQRLHRAPAGRRMAHHHGQPVGRAGAGEVQRPLRVHAGGRHHPRYAGWPQRQRGLGQGGAGQGQRRHGRCAPDPLVRRARGARHAQEQRHVPAVGHGRWRGAAARGHAPGAGQAVAHAAVGGGRAAPAAVQRGLHPQAHGHAG